MKKNVLFFLVLFVVFCLIGCNSNKQTNVLSDTSVEETVETNATLENKPQTTADLFELALVTDLGTIDDKSFNQGAWEGVKKYADENNITCKYYQPQESGTNAYLRAIDLAVEGGAKLVVCPGFLFEEPVYLAQEKYPEVSFILLDGEPHNADYSDYKTGPNSMPILYQEDQAGFLAGYAAAKDGNKKFGFLGGVAVPSVIRYGFGFAQGINEAAKELGVDCELVYNYTGQFSATPEAQALAASWYNSGTEVIFGCGGAVGNSAMSAAESQNQTANDFVAKVVGVDVDQYSESDTVITSAMKLLSNSVYEAVTAYYNGSFKGGVTSKFDVHNNGVGIAMENAKFKTFNESDYNAIYERLKNNEIEIINDTEDYDPSVALQLSNLKITFID